MVIFHNDPNSPKDKPQTMNLGRQNRNEDCICFKLNTFLVSASFQNSAEVAYIINFHMFNRSSSDSRTKQKCLVIICNWLGEGGGQRNEKNPS